MYSRNIRMFPWFYGLWGFCPYSVIAILYYEQLTGSYAVAMSVFAASSVFSSLLEIPMGVISDLIGRRRTMIAGGISFLCGDIFYVMAGYCPANALIILYAGAVCKGMSVALFSGTDEAIVYESLNALGKKKEFDRFYGKARSANQFTIGFAAVLGSLIAYYFSFHAVYEAALLSSAALALFNFGWKEPPAADFRGDLSVWRHLNEAAAAFRTKSRLRWLALADILEHSTGMVTSRFETAYAQLLIPTWLLGGPRVLKQIFGTMSFWFAGRVIKKYKAIRVMIYAEYGRIVPRLAGLALNNFLSPFMLVFSNIFYGASVTGLKSLLQKQYLSRQRATMSSMISMGTNAAFAILSVILGLLADMISVRAALFIFVGFRGIILLIYYRLGRRKS